jgi:ABC-type nickel/cobalt efflux system permease component RcnA
MGATGGISHGWKGARMTGLDQWIAELGAGNVFMAMLVAVLLGLRHASDPDHLTAVSSLVLADEEHGGRRASLLGLSWGLGHATTLVAFGLPVVLFRSYLPQWVQHAAEFVIGLVIVALAVRLLTRWRRGYFHGHPHTHGAVRHAHPHVHEAANRSEHPVAHAHSHGDAIGRSPLAAFGIGLMHGAGGSAGVGILLIATIPDRTRAAVALALFAGATALSMAIASSLFGYVLARESVSKRLRAMVPVFGLASLAFGIWYSVTAW